MSSPSKILVLDDDYNQRELLQSYLEITGNFSVDTACDAEEFWTSLLKQTYDLIFLDYKLPGTNGLEILSGLKARDYDIPVIMMTGEGDERIAAQAIQRGAVDYLVKGDDVFQGLPGVINKAIQIHNLQRSVQESMEQVRFHATLLDNVRDAVVVWDLNGKITYWNPAAHILYGWSAEERVGQNVEDTYLNIFHPPIVVPKLEDSSGFVIEREFKSRDHRRVWVSSRLTPLRSEKNTRQLIGYMDVSRDITQRRVEQQALKESQRFVQQIVDTTPNLLYIFDLEDRQTVFCNRESANILGLSANEVQKMSLQDLAKMVHEDDRGSLREHFQQVALLPDGMVCEVEFRLLDRNGRWHWLLSRNAVFLRGLDRKARQVIGIAQDITARKRAEESLEHRALIEQLIASVSVNFLNMPPENTQEGIREALSEVSQFSAADLACLFQVFPGERRLHPIVFWNQEGGQHYAWESCLDGEWMWESLLRMDFIHIPRLSELPPEADRQRLELELRGIKSLLLIPLFYNNMLIGLLGLGTKRNEKTWNREDLGMVKTLGSIFVNALVQQRVELALRESESRYRAIVEDHQTEMIFRFLPDGTLTFVNENYCHVFDSSRQSLIGMNFLEYLPVEDRAQVESGYRGLSSSQPVCIVENRVMMPHDEYRWFECTYRAIFAENGEISEYQAVGRDITERKIMEAQIQAAQVRLTQASRLASIGTLASSIAHQIYNPLTTIIGEAQFLRQQTNGNKLAGESVQAIEDAGWRAQRVVEELMRFSDDEASHNELVDLASVIAKAVLLVSGDLLAHGMKLDNRVPLDLEHVRANAHQMQDLFVNLLLVSRSFHTSTHPVSVEISSRGDDLDEVIIDFELVGMFLDQQGLDKLFEPRLIPAGPDKLTGMELSICQEIVRQNEGEISAVGTQRGISISVRMPREASNGNS